MWSQFSTHPVGLRARGGSSRSTDERKDLTVDVWGRPHAVSVRQKSKSVWIAGGDYMGERIESKGSSPSFALAHWQEAARYKGN